MKNKIIIGLMSFIMTLTIVATSIGENTSGIFDSASISASAETSGDYEYELLDDGTVEITAYTGSATELIIPSTIAGKKVTSISDSAFYNGYDGDEELESHIKSVKIPNGVTSIGDYAFGGCKRLITITIPNSVTSIGYRAFSETKWLENRQKENPLVVVNGILIDGSTSTGYIVIPNNVIAIADGAFSYNEALTSVTIPNSVKIIEDCAFYECSNLKNIIIPDSITSIGYRAFSETKWLENRQKENPLVVANGMLIDGSTLTGNLTISNSITQIIDGAFDHCTGLTSVTIPSSVKSIGNSAFRWCYKLKSISLPDNGIKIGELAFLDCLNLKSVVIPKTAMIGNCAFGYFNTIFNEQGQPVGGGGIWKDDNFDFKVKCYFGTAGEKYAIDNGFDYELLDTPAHTHSYTSKITKQPTCTETGVRTYTCSCGDSYTETIPATGHKYLITVVKPTYFEQGYTLHKCSVCGNSYKDNYTAKLTLATVSNFKVTKTAYNAIKLDWNAVPNADGYIIWRYDFAKKQWIKINDNVKTNTFLFTHLNSGTKYRFAVRAFKKVNGKTVTSPSFPVVNGYTNLPTVSGFKVTSTANNAIKLGWNKVLGANGYYIYRYDYVKKQWKLINNNVKTNTFLFTHLNSGSNYKFAVRAFKKIDGKNILSQSFPTVESSTNPATVNFKVTAGSKKATVKWNKVTGATGYNVYYKTSKNSSWKLLKTVNNKTTSYTKTGLSKGKTFYFTVKAYRTVGGKTYNGSFTTKSVKIK